LIASGLLRLPLLLIALCLNVVYFANIKNDMFIFAHIGITLGAATVVSAVYDQCRSGINRVSQNNSVLYSSERVTKTRKTFSQWIGLESLSRFLDIRLLVIGSMFPDIIDKPLEFLGWGSGRAIGHTLLITLVCIVASLIVLFKNKNTWLLAIALGMITHLILDFMWVTPRVFLWPLYGWSFPGHWLQFDFSQIGLWWNILLNNITVDITEIIGIVIILGIISAAIGSKGLKKLIMKGKL
jgi:inner membrane protein